MSIRKIVVALCAAALVFAGCAKKKAAVADKPYKVIDYTLTAEKPIKGAPNVYLIVKSIDNAYFKVMIEAARHAAAEFACNVYYSGSEKSSEWEAQADLMDIAKERGADAVIIAPDDTKKLVGKIAELYGAGISVICVDAAADTDKYNVCYMTNNLAAGEAAAVEMLDKMKAKGFDQNESLKVAIQTGRANSQSTNDRIMGFTEYWTKNAPEKWEIIPDIKPNDSNKDKARENTEAFFKEHQNIKGLFGLNNASTSAFSKYLAANTLRDVVLVGFDYSTEAEMLINDSSYSVSVVVQRQYDMAFRGVATALDIKNKKFSPDSKIVDTGVTIINNSNAKDPETMKALGLN